MAFALFICILIGHNVLACAERRKIRAEVLNIQASLSRTSFGAIQETNDSGQKLQTRDTSGYFITVTNTAKPGKDVVRTPTVEMSSTTSPVASKAMHREAWLKDHWTSKKVTLRSTTTHETERRFSAQPWKISSEAIDPSARAESNFPNYEPELLRRKRLANTNELVKQSLVERTRLYNRFPEEFTALLSATDKEENFLLLAYAQKSSRSILDVKVAKYNETLTAERKALKEMLQSEGYDTDQMLANYKLVRNGVAWNYQLFNTKLNSFFATPSALLEEYKLLKKYERNSLDSYLNTTPKFPENQTRQVSVIGKTEAYKPEAAEDTTSEANKPETNTKMTKDPHDAGLPRGDETSGTTKTGGIGESNLWMIVALVAVSTIGAVV